MGKFNTFEEIVAWQKSREFNKRIYEITNKEDFKRDFELVKTNKKSINFDLLQYIRRVRKKYR